MLIGEISVLYYPLIVLIGLYLGILFIINKIPNITVKALGWLAIKHVTIGTNGGKIYIRKVKFTINAFRSRDSPLKLFNLELYDMEIRAIELAPEVHEKDERTNGNSMSESDISKFLTFCIPNRLYEILFKRRILNRFNLHLYRTAVYIQGMDDLMKAFFDYARLESIFGLEEKSRFVITIINGYVQKKELSGELNHYKFIRNVEFCITCDTILSCMNDAPNKLSLKVGNFDLALSLGKMSLPIDTLMLFKKEFGNDKRQSNILKKSEILRFSECFFEIFSSLDIKLEDFNMTYQDIKIQVANFQTLVTNKHLLRYDDKNLMDLLFFLTSYKLFHKGDKSIEIPSAALECTFESMELLEILLEISEGTIDSLQANKKLNIESSLTITKPSIDIYYDQMDLLFKSHIPHKEDGTKSKNTFDLHSILGNIRKVSNKILIVDTTVNFHLPKLGDEFHRGSILNIIVSCTLLSFYHKFFTKSLKNRIPKELKGPHKFNIDGYFKLKALKFNVVDNLIQLSKANLLISYSLLERQIAIKLINKDVKLKSINDIIFHLVRKYRNQIIENQNRTFASLNQSIERRRLSHKIESEKMNKVNYLELFEVLPTFISSFKFTSANIQADIACKDGLPNHIVFEEFLQKEINLGDFRRGVSIKLNDIEFSYKRLKEEISSSVRSVQCFTVSEYANELDVDSDVDDYNSSDADFSDLSSLKSEDSVNIDTEKIKRVKRVLNISDILIRNFCADKENEKERDTNNLHLHISTIDGNLDIFLVWCSFYALSLVRYFAPTVQKDYTKEEISEIKGPSKKLKLDILVDSTAIRTRLPNNVEILLEFDTVKMKNIFIAKAANFNFARLYVVHPSTKLWTRLLIVKESIFRYNSVIIDDQGGFESIAESIRLNIPHQFLFYTVIDNIITFVKAVKQIGYNFDHLYYKIDDFKRIMPHEKRTNNIPKVVVKSKIFGITLENDLFENELSYIYELGLIEQKQRLKKLKLFEAKVQDIIANTKPTIDEKVKLTNQDPAPRKFVSSTGGFSPNPKVNSPLRKVFSESGFHLRSHLHLHTLRDKFHRQKKENVSSFEEDDQAYQYTTDQDANLKIKDAQETLNKQFATSWIKKYKKFRSFKIHTWNKRAISAWGEERIHPRIAEKFNILSYASGPHMMCGYFKDIDLTIDQAKIDNVDDFIYKYGKKQPRLEYSILIPLFISLKSSSMYVMLRDYPLPLLSFPSNDNPNKPTINFSGNFVINERLVQARDEMRFIYVPFSPAAMTSSDESDNFYSVFVPRTLTPVKVILNMQCDLDTNRPCMITWCKSYSAGLLAALAAFDKFTKPKIDYSPIGWWDKVALLVHGKAVFNINNELCLHMKASTSPYELIGRAAGFVFCWKNNVSLRLNNNGKSEDLLMLDSDDFVLAIPNYSLAERSSWNLFYEHHSIYSEESDTDSKRFKKKVMQLTSSDRVRWVLGAAFERNKNKTNDLSDQQPRTSIFKPHYDVRVTSSDLDSYEEYRSDYIHIALSVVSKSSSGNSYNAAYLTPLIFHYFFHWWDTLTKHTSLPVKSGRLFSQEPVDISHVKMGSHIFTVKYQLVFEPISISHLYIHSSSGELDQQSKTAFTGLKGKFSTCAIDLHQRKEQIRYVNEKLNINNKVLHLKMNEGGVDINEADIRFVNAIFNEKSVRGYLATFMKGSNSSDSASSPSQKSLDEDINNFSDWIENVDVFDNDNSWIDPADYVELHQSVQPSSHPSIRIMPFFFSPKFTYFREFSLHENGPFPFGKEIFHKCIIGLEKPEKTQAILLTERKKNVEREIQVHEEQLPGLEPSDSSETLNDDIERIKEDIEICKEKLNIIESIKQNLPDMTGNSNTDLNLEENLSAGSEKSTESSSTNYNNMKEMNNSNPSVSEFHNRFVIHNPQLKWHNDLRDLFMEYIKRVGDRKSQVYFMSKKAVDLAETFINARREEDEAEEEGKESNTNNSAEGIFSREYKTGEEILKNFNQQLNEIHNDDQEVEDKYLIKLIHPQIQLVSEKDINACILVTSTDVELRVVSINVKGMNDVVSENNGVGKLVESRYGVSFKDSHVFAFKKTEASVTGSDVPYGSKFSDVNWPPWLEPETCYESSWLKDQLVVERTSMSFLFMKPNHLVASDCKTTIQNNEVSLHVSKLVITANSEQYSTLYYVITDLLLHVNTQRDTLLNRLDKIVSLSDIKEFDGLNIRIKELQDNIRTYLDILLKLNQRDILLDSEQKEQSRAMEVELERMNIELFVLMNGLGVKSSKNQVNNKQTARLLTVEADQIIWHLLNEDKKPFIDFALAKCRFIRVDSVDGANINKAEVSMAQGFNLQKDAMYPELLTPHLDLNDYTIPDCNKDSPVLSTTWKMLNHIGGIPIMQDAKVEVQPLKVQLDYHSTKKLFDYLFPKTEVSAEDEENEMLEFNEEIKNYGDTKKRKTNPFKKLINKERNILVESILKDSDTIGSSNSDTASTAVSSSDDIVFGTDTTQDTAKSIRERTSTDMDNDTVDDISIIMNRSSKYVSIVNLEISRVKLSISFNAPKHLSILNVRDLALTIPTLRYRNKMWSAEEFVLRLRKDIIKIILNHTGKILGNKFKPTKKKPKLAPLKQISNYASFITLQDLQLKDEEELEEEVTLDISSHKLNKTNGKDSWGKTQLDTIVDHDKSEGSF